MDFTEEIRRGITKTPTVSKVERGKFRFTEWDIHKFEDVIKVSMKDYTNSMEEVKDIRRADRNEALTRLEMKYYRNFTGKLS